MYIKMTDTKELIITVPTAIYRGETNADMITFLVPLSVGGHNIADCTLSMRYVLPSNTGRSEILYCKPEMYQDYLQYTTALTTRLTAEEGMVRIWLSALSSDGSTVIKTGEVLVRVYPSRNIADYLPEDGLDQIDRLEAQVSRLVQTKADDLVFHEEDNTIQLIANGNEIGGRIVVSTQLNDVYVTNVSLNDDGELLIALSNGAVENVGKVSCDGAAIYVPHIDDHKILTFTLENEPGDVPPPVDLNPSDEWGAIDDSEVISDYVWEEL